VFYGWWDWRFLILIAFTTLCSYISGLLIEHFEGKRQSQKWVSATNIILNLAILGVFKYYNFLLTTLFHSFLFGTLIWNCYTKYHSPCRHQLLHFSGSKLYYRCLSA
jgi:phage-related holin